VTKNLRALNYGDDLLPTSFKREVIKAKLPRHTISSLYLDDLFTMGSALDSYTSALVWKTVTTLETNWDLYQ